MGSRPFNSQIIVYFQNFAAFPDFLLGGYKGWIFPAVSLGAMLGFLQIVLIILLCSLCYFVVETQSSCKMHAPTLLWNVSILSLVGCSGLPIVY